jgi:hypothetical protein
LGHGVVSTVQYLRKVSVVIASETQRLDFALFRCKFQIRKGDQQTPNSCDVRIYNLDVPTANTIAPTNSEFKTLIVQAGYEGNFGTIFSGSIAQVRIGRESQLDTYVDVTAADGDDAYSFAAVSAAQASVNPGGLAKLLQNAMSVYSVNTPAIPQFIQDKVVDSQRGYSSYGSVKDELRLLADNGNFYWSIQDANPTYVSQTQAPTTEAIAIGPNSGLIGTPEQTQNGIVFRTLLNANIKVCSLIQLNATINRLRFGVDLLSQATNVNSAAQNNINANGLYYVMNCSHDGDTRGTEWYTTATCLAIDSRLANVDLTGALIAAPPPTVRYGP